MKNCPKCNAELADDAMFCNECGAKLEAPKAEEVKTEAVKTETVSPAIPQPAAAPANSVLEGAKAQANNANVGIIAVAIVAIIAIIIVVLLLTGGKKADKVIKDYMAAFEKGNAETLLNLECPKDTQDDYIDDYYDCDVDDYIEAYNAGYKVLWAGLKDEGKLDISYEIKASESLKKLDDLKKDAKSIGIKDFDDFVDLMDDYYDDYFDAKKIKDAYIVDLKWEVTVDGDKICKESGIVVVFQYSGNWYVLGDLPDFDYIMDSIIYDSDLRDDYEDMLDDFSDVYDDYDDVFPYYYSYYL